MLNNYDQQKLNIKEEPAFSRKGLKGYQYILQNKEVEVYIVDVTQGHESYFISRKITHMYYILEGSGTFDIDNKKIEVNKGNFIEVPPGIEYTYSGKMKLLLFMSPPWFEENEEITKPNPVVF